MTGLSINPLDHKSPTPPSSSRKCAYIVFLLSTPSYLPGILVLNHSLKKVKSAYPLIVAVNPSVPAEARKALEEAGLEIRVVRPLKPSGKVTLIAERFADTWTKLAVFDLVEFERIVLIDGDMMVRQNMDELFDFPLAKDNIAATFGCICNLDRSDWAPDFWTRENCPFTRQAHPTAITSPPPTSPTGPSSLLNSGLVVLHPSHSISSLLHSTLTDPSNESLISTWMFPDQDLLQHVFQGKWVNMPWIYNAIKTFRYWHGSLYSDEEVRNLHYICDKPWKRRPERVEGGKGGYVVDAEGYEGVLDGVLGNPDPRADAITHGWWWDEWEEMVGEYKEGKYPSLGYLVKLVDGEQL